MTLPLIIALTVIALGCIALLVMGVKLADARIERDDALETIAELKSKAAR